MPARRRSWIHLAAHLASPARIRRKSLAPADVNQTMIRLLIAIVIAASLLSPSTEAAARPDGVGNDAAASPLDELIARRLVQHCARFVRPGAESDPQSGFRTAVGILTWATRLAPDDAEIHRRLAAAGAILDPDLPAIIEGERNLLRLEPDNAMAQLQVINRAIDQRQSVSERFALCQRLLGSEAGGRLDRAVRSHVAFRAAALAQEQGRASIASTYLQEALKHNPANLDAAALHVLEIDRQTAKVELLVRALVGLVKADPTNRAALADLIAAVQESGHHRGAADLIEAMSALSARHGESISDDLFAEYAFLRCADSEPQVGLDLVNQRQASFDRFERQRLQAAWAREQQLRLEKAVAEGKPRPDVGEMPAFADVSVPLSLNLQLTRALLADAAGAEGDVETALAALEAGWSARLEELKAADRSSLPASAVAALEAEEQQVIADRAGTRLWLNRKLDEAAADIADLERRGATNLVELARLRGWLNLRRGAAQEAMAHLTPLESSGPLCDLGIALAQIELGRSADAARLLGEIFQSQPGRLIGVLCKWRYEKLTGRRMPVPRNARAVEQELERVPQVLGDLLLRPQRYLSLSVAPASASLAPLDPMTFNVTIGNDSAWPVAIGPGKIVPNRLALFPIFRVSGRRVQTGTPPLAVDLQRQLVILPSSSVTLPVSIDHTLFGLLIPSLALRPLSVEFQAMLDYQVSPDGKFVPRPWSLVRQSSATQVAPWPNVMAGAEPDLAAELTIEDPMKTVRAISKIGAVMHARLTKSLDVTANAALIAAADAGLERLIELWPDVEPRVAAWAVLSLPFQTGTSQTRLEVLERFEATARRSEAPLVQLAWIAARAGSESDVVIEGALRSDDPELRRIAGDAAIFLAAPAPASDPSGATGAEDEPVK